MTPPPLFCRAHFGLVSSACVVYTATRLSPCIHPSICRVESCFPPFLSFISSFLLFRPLLFVSLRVRASYRVNWCRWRHLGHGDRVRDEARLQGYKATGFLHSLVLSLQCFQLFFRSLIYCHRGRDVVYLLNRSRVLSGGFLDGVVNLCGPTAERTRSDSVQ